MICLPIIKSEVEQARMEAERQGRLRQSATGIDGNFVGFLGEFSVLRFLRHLGATRCNTFNYDFEIHGRKLDVKTKARKTPPKPEWLASVTAGCKKSDGFVFVSVTMDKMEPREIHLCGWLPWGRFFQLCSKQEKGSRDSETGFVALMDANTIAYKDLEPMQQLEAGVLAAKYLGR